MIDLTNEVIALLSPLEATVTADYPLTAHEWPVVTVSMRESVVTARADAADYAEDVVMGVEAFAADYLAALSLSKDIDALLSAYGLRRVGYAFSFDPSARAYRAAMLYRGVLCGDIIYQ